MAPLEQEMFANPKVVYQTGKGNDHLAPVLVPTDVAPALCLLAQPDNRKGVGVSKDNPFLFPAVHDGKLSLQWVSLRASSGQLGWRRGRFHPDGDEDASLLQHTLSGSGCAAEPAQLLLPAHGSFSTNQ